MSEPSSLFSRRTRRLSLAAIALVGASLLTYHYVAPEITGGRDIAAAEADRLSAVQIAPVPLPVEGGTWTGPAGATWPAAGATELTPGASGKAGGIPVAVKARPGKKAPAKVKVAVLDQQTSEKLGVSGPVLTVDGDSGEFDTTVDFAGFANLYGGGFAGRMTLLELPACAATTPQVPECQVASRTAVAKSGSLMSAAVATGAGPRVFAVSAETESDEGDYKASDLQASGSWTAGDSAGAFTYTNAIRVPDAEGPTPDVSLSYSSQTVDGRQAGRNNQASWAGDGWDYTPGFIERTYVTCTDDRDKQDGKEANNKDKKTSDQCWKDDSPSVTVSLDGTNSTLIRDDDSKKWRVQQDKNWDIDLVGSPATKADATSERWVITTPDGTKNYFASDVGDANSRWTVPVFGNHDGEKCHATAFKDSSCKQAWRWMLDKTVDVNGNTTRYYYQDETGYYGAADDKNNRVSFTRGGYLKHIDYGLNSAYPSVAATGRVLFATADRCFADCMKDGKPVKASWPDVPWDKECTAEPCTDKLAPVFFSTKRLTKITTQLRSGADFDNVESWTLNQEFKAPKIKGSASLWLKEIVHAGHVGGTITDPPVQFTGVELANRVNAAAGAPLFSRWRITNVRTESGADLKVTYNEADCDANDLPSAVNNSRLCYPVHWTPDGYFDPTLDWFRKYVVKEITEYDRTADQPSVTRTYDYSTEGGGTTTLWAYDDSEFTKKKHRTYGQWRGYARVTTRTGANDKPKLVSRKQFFRGLDDQPLSGDDKREVQVSDSEGNTFTDHPTMAGFVLEEATLDGTTVVDAKTTTYWTKETATRVRTGGSDKAYLTGPSVEKARKLLTAGVWQRTEKRTAYNDEGQPTTVSDLGDTGRTGDEQCATTTYVANKDVWLRGLPSRVETVAKACGAAVSRPADVISDVKTYYDGSATHGATPDKGQVTREDTLNSWSGGPVYTMTSAKAYDPLGRVKSSTDANHQVTTTSYVPAGPGPVTRTITRNPKQHETITDQVPAFAQPTSILDANAKRTTLRYDPMGRLTRVWLPGRDLDKIPNLEFGYQIRTDGPLAVTSKRLAPDGHQLVEVGLFDSLYRSVQTQTDALGKTRLVDTTGYDDKGQVAYKSIDKHADGDPSDQLLQITPGEDRNRTVNEYDAVGRVTSETLWSQNKRYWATTTTYGGSPDGWQVSVTPPAGGTAKATIADADGRTIEVREFKGATPSGDFDATTYTHTPRGDLATVTKGKAVWRYEYDLRGREVRTVDPDKGTTLVEYNNDDDVTKSTDADGGVITTRYDELGRQIERSFNGKVAATWTYDTLAKGHLTKSVSKIDGFDFVKEIYEYNDAYQVVDEESVIPAMPGLQKVAGKYVSTYTYNVDGSKARSTLPKVGATASEILANTYDEVGNAVRLIGTMAGGGPVTSYVQEATYSPYGEVLKRALGTDKSPQGFQSYVYEDATRRLQEFYFDRDGTEPNVAALKYSYDDAGNVLSMANRPLAADDETVRAGEEDVQCFGYDHLRRLAQAWSQAGTTCAQPAAGGISPYHKSWSFNEAGSRTSTTDHRAGRTSTYAYDENAAQPHAVRSVTTGSQVDHYDWSKTGNLTYRKVGDATETFTWSPHGKLTKISGPQGDTTMVYDVDGNRIARVDPNGSATAYVAGHELTASGQGTTTTRYYEHAGDTIASRTDTTAAKGDVIWLGADQHDSATWAVNSRTRVPTIRYNDPYGNPRSGAGQPAWPAGQRGFVGGVADPTGLTLLGARFYDPTLGAFISVDPEIDELDPQRMHPFAYANNNPVTFADPDGLFWGSIKNGIAKAANSVAGGVTSAAKAVVNNAGTIASVAGTIAMVAAVLPPPAQVVAAAAGAVAAVAGAIDTIKTCAGGDKAGCAMGAAGMIPGVRQAKNAARGVGAVKNAARSAEKKLPEPGCKTPNSFLPGTPVLMADGSHKSIEDITLDDQVRALDPETGQEGARPVTTLITGSGDKKLVAIDLDTDGDERADDRIHATDGHPFWVDQAQDWLRADELVARHALITPDGARVTVLAVLAYDAVATVHNLTVDDLHTYFVAAAGTEVLVHNCGGKHRDPDEAASTNDGYVGNHRAAGQHRVQEKPGLFTPRHEARPGHRALSLHDRSLPHRMGIYEGIARQDKFDNGAGRLFAMLPGSWSTYVSTSIRSYIFVRGYRAGYRSMTRAPASHQRGPIYRGRHRSYD